MTLLLSQADVMQVLKVNEAINVVEKAFIEFTKGDVDMPQRPIIRVPEHNGLCAFMPAWLPTMRALAIKLVTAFKGNVQRGLPTVLGVIELLDPETGAPLAIMDGGYLTAVRTGAASGVATKYLAREDAHVVAVFGAGVQGRTQLQAVCAVREINEVRVFDIDSKAAERFAQEMGGQCCIPTKIDVVDSPREALLGVNIVATATTSPTPVFDGDDLAPGMHINGIGSHAPTVRELDTKTVVRSKIICDSLDACLAEAGDLLIPMQEGTLNQEDIIYGQLGEVITGKLSGRESDEEITLFKSVGLAFQDASVALYVYQKAREESVGTEFEF